MAYRALAGIQKIEIEEQAAPRQRPASEGGIGPVIDPIGEGKIHPDFMITRRFRLDQADNACELLADYRDGVIKAVVDMG
jgi:threonine dehydrogenase-like Zn-dependent dehydrogenase